MYASLAQRSVWCSPSGGVQPCLGEQRHDGVPLLRAGLDLSDGGDPGDQAAALVLAADRHGDALGLRQAGQRLLDAAGHDVGRALAVLPRVPDVPGRTGMRAGRAGRATACPTSWWPPRPAPRCPRPVLHGPGPRGGGRGAGTGRRRGGWIASGACRCAPAVRRSRCPRATRGSSRRRRGWPATSSSSTWRTRSRRRPSGRPGERRRGPERRRTGVSGSASYGSTTRPPRSRTGTSSTSSRAPARTSTA